MDTGQQAAHQALTSTQIGAVGEAVVATGLMLASNGRLSPYKPIADDDGTDLLVVDKQTRKIIPIQVKSRTKVDDPRAETVQFDVRLKTFAQDGKGYILAVLLDGADLRAAWLIPSGKLAEITTATAEKRVIVASAKSDTKDRCRQFRHDDFQSVTRAILEERAAPL
jgi:hypothetical protein